MKRDDDTVYILLTGMIVVLGLGSLFGVIYLLYVLFEVT